MCIRDSQRGIIKQKYLNICNSLDVLDIKDLKLLHKLERESKHSNLKPKNRTNRCV